MSAPIQWQPLRPIAAGGRMDGVSVSAAKEGRGYAARLALGGLVLVEMGWKVNDFLLIDTARIDGAVRMRLRRTSVNDGWKLLGSGGGAKGGKIIMRPDGLRQRRPARWVAHERQGDALLLTVPAWVLDGDPAPAPEPAPYRMGGGPAVGRPSAPMQGRGNA